MVDTNLRMSPLQNMELSQGLKELSFATQINIRGNPDDPAFSDAMIAVLGTALPAEPNRVVSGTDLSVLWLGPDEWMVVAEDGSSLIDQLNSALDGQHVAINDLSANRTVIELSGPNALNTLIKSCDMDIHPRVFGPDQVAQTMIAKSQVTIVCKKADIYHIYVRCSFSRYVAAWLSDALLEYQD